MAIKKQAIALTIIATTGVLAVGTAGLAVPANDNNIIQIANQTSSKAAGEETVELYDNIILTNYGASFTIKSSIPATVTVTLTDGNFDPLATIENSFAAPEIKLGDNNMTIKNSKPNVAYSGKLTFTAAGYTIPSQDIVFTTKALGIDVPEFGAVTPLPTTATKLNIFSKISLNPNKDEGFSEPQNVMVGVVNKDYYYTEPEYNMNVISGSVVPPESGVRGQNIVGVDGLSADTTYGNLWMQLYSRSTPDEILSTILIPEFKTPERSNDSLIGLHDDGTITPAALSTGAIIGISIASVILLMIPVVILWYKGYFRKVN